MELKRARQVERRRERQRLERLLPPEEIERRQLHRKYMRLRRKDRAAGAPESNRPGW
jgi:hypothetical protein